MLTLNAAVVVSSPRSLNNAASVAMNPRNSTHLNTHYTVAKNVGRQLQREWACSAKRVGVQCKESGQAVQREWAAAQKAPFSFSAARARSSYVTQLLFGAI
jgi:hypothetical protein